MRTHPLLLTLLLTAPTLAATTQPATRPTDPSDPRAAVAAFLSAVQSADRDAIRNALLIPLDDQQTVDTFLDLVFATANLQSAAAARFHDDATPYFGAAGNQLETRLKALEDAPLKTTGNSAILTLPANEAAHQSGGTIILKKVGPAWKLDAPTLFSLANTPKDQTDRRVALARKLVTITRATTDDITAGKFASAGEAFQEFWTRSLAAAKQIDTATTAPATQPR